MHADAAGRRPRGRLSYLQAVDIIGISLFPPTMTRTSGLTVAPGRCVHEVIAEAFGYERQQEVQRVLFGDTDVLEGESFEDHGIEVAGVAALLTANATVSNKLTSGSAVRVVRTGRGSAQASRRGRRASGKRQLRL